MQHTSFVARHHKNSYAPLSHTERKLNVLSKMQDISSRVLPSLENIFDKFLRKTTVSLRNLAKDTIDAEEMRVYCTRFGEYIDALSSPSLMAVFQIEQWNCFSILRIDETLLDTIIDSLLGGREHKQYHRDHGKLTHIEQTLIEKFVNVMLADFSAIFSNVTPIHCILDRIEFVPRFAMISPASSATIIMETQFLIGTQKGGIELAIPQIAFSYIQHDLPQLSSEKEKARTPGWQEHMKNEILSTTLEVRAVLKNMVVPLQETLTWRVGTYIPLGISADSPITLCCENETFFSGIMGQKAHCIAVQIQKGHKGE
ncbi:MAG: FliM/FliN family flagellar motor switch protein [Holosporales bacterium]|jgi:flagellar motor switch protein FliM|nr:FliM/FliN family flagellar motor switch protein [Holosporales bacterium]